MNPVGTLNSRQFDVEADPALSSCIVHPRRVSFLSFLPSLLSLFLLSSYSLSGSPLQAMYMQRHDWSL